MHYLVQIVLLGTINQQSAFSSGLQYYYYSNSAYEAYQHNHSVQKCIYMLYIKYIWVYPIAFINTKAASWLGFAGTNSVPEYKDHIYIHNKSHRFFNFGTKMWLFWVVGWRSKPTNRLTWYQSDRNILSRGTILNKTYGTQKKLILLTIFGPILLRHPVIGTFRFPQEAQKHLIVSIRLTRMIENTRHISISTWGKKTPHIFRSD